MPPAEIFSASVRRSAKAVCPKSELCSEDSTPSTRMRPIKAILIAREIIRALVSMPEAMPTRSGVTAPVAALVTVVLVNPRPMPANTHPGSIVAQLAFSTLAPIFIMRKPRPIVNRPAGMTIPGRRRSIKRSAKGGTTSGGRV
ncbi:hypothetical protein D3C71_1729240 [compost metagenome]